MRLKLRRRERVAPAAVLDDWPESDDFEPRYNLANRSRVERLADGPMDDEDERWFNRHRMWTWADREARMAADYKLYRQLQARRMGLVTRESYLPRHAAPDTTDE